MKFLLKAIQLLEWFARAPRGLLFDLRCKCAMSLGRGLEWFICRILRILLVHVLRLRNKLMPIIRR
jgi:hypothetical protein